MDDGGMVMTKADIFLHGYAIPIYHMDKATKRWQFMDEAFTTPASVRTEGFGGWYVAPIDEVRRHAQ